MPYKNIEKKREQVRKWKQSNKEKVLIQTRRRQWREHCEKDGEDPTVPMPDGFVPSGLLRQRKPKPPAAYKIRRAEKMGIPVENYTREQWEVFLAGERAAAQVKKEKMREVLAERALQRRRDAKRKSSKRARQWVWEYKSQRACVRCGFSHAAALQFHHKRDKRREVSQIKTLGAIKMEIEKCELLCANCHAIEHYEQGRAAQSVDQVGEGSPT